MLRNIRRIVPAHLLVIVAAVAFVSFVGGVFYSYYFENQSVPANTPPTPTPPSPPDAPLAPYTPLAPEEEAAREQRRESQSVSEPAEGLATMGKTIEVGDRFIKLPEDAYIAKHILFGICPSDVDCPQPPFYVIVRGDSEIYLETDGDIWQMTVDENHPGAFNFLGDLLPESAEFWSGTTGSSSMSHLEANIGALQEPRLPEEDSARIKALFGDIAEYA